MARTVAVRSHTRTLSDKHPQVFYRRCDELHAGLIARDFPALLEEELSKELAEFAEQIKREAR